MKKYGYAAAVTVAIGCVVASAYFLFFKPQIPECQAVEHVTFNVDGRTVERVMLVSFVPSGRRQVTVLLSGRVYDGKNRYVVSRILVMDYVRQGANYSLLVKENIVKPYDTTSLEGFNRRLPAEGSRLHWRIERLDDKHFLFADNHAPLLVCAVR